MKIFSILILFILPATSFAQGLNNDYKYDQTDIDALFKMNHIDVYKFSLPCTDSSNKYNFILYDYKDGKLVDSLNYSLLTQAEDLWLDSTGSLKDTISLSALKELMKKGQVTIDSSQTQNTATDVQVSQVKESSPAANGKVEEKEAPFSQLLQTEKGSENILRVYIKYDTNRISLKLLLNGTDITEALDFNEKTYGSRAMIEKTDTIKARTRLLTIYGINQNNKLLHCAQNDSDELLKKRMDELIVLYLEPIK